MAIKSNDDQFKILADSKNDEPFVMLNLLKFKKEGGREAYLRYVKEASPFVAEVGAKMVYFGKPKELLNGTEEWDLLMLVQYPSRKAFLKMADNSDYLRIHKWREKGVERAVLYATDPAKPQDILSQ